jgi:hypothetical protein
MRIISLIDDAGIIKKILKHLDLWDVKRKPRSVANGPPIDVFPAIQNPLFPADFSQLPGRHDNLHSV